jgi:hypothetical protein
MRQTASIRINIAWWARLYLVSVATFAALTGMEPDMAKVAAVVKRGMRVQVS